MSNNRIEQKKFLTRVLITGLLGGVIWSLFTTILYEFNFIEVSLNSYLIQSWLINEWTATWKGTVLAIITGSFISIGIALIYYVLFRKINSILMGIGFGIMLWIIFALLTQYTFENIKPFTEFNQISIFSTLCIFILYGTFIGYTISFDYFETYSLRAKQIISK